ncbi:MAG: hypothetical protein RRY54_00970, partial [Angelakisella sp.]
MLVKLIKYEFKSTARVFLPIYALLLFFAVLGNFALGNTFAAAGDSDFGNIISGIVMFGYVMAIFSIIIVTAVVILQRFYKNLTGDEGYLMHTLPVSVHSHILSKGLVAFVWEIASIAMVLLSVFILCFHPSCFVSFSEFWSELCQVIQFCFAEIGFGLIANIALMIVTMIASVIYETLFIYAAISIGHTFKKHRIVASVGAYMIMNMISQFIVGMLTFAVGSFGWASFDFDVAVSAAALSNIMSIFLSVSILGIAIFAAIFYFIT